MDTIRDWGTIHAGDVLYENDMGISKKFTVVMVAHVVLGPRSGDHAILAEDAAGNRWMVDHSADCPDYLRPCLSKAPQYMRVEE